MKSFFVDIRMGLSEALMHMFADPKIAELLDKVPVYFVSPIGTGRILNHVFSGRMLGFEVPTEIMNGSYTHQTGRVYVRPTLETYVNAWPCSPRTYTPLLYGVAYTHTGVYFMVSNPDFADPGLPERVSDYSPGRVVEAVGLGLWGGYADTVRFTDLDRKFPPSSVTMSELASMQMVVQTYTEEMHDREFKWTRVEEDVTEDVPAPDLPPDDTFEIVADGYLEQD